MARAGDTITSKLAHSSCAISRRPISVATPATSSWLFWASLRLAFLVVSTSTSNILAVWAEMTEQLAPVSGVVRTRVNPSCPGLLKCIATSGIGREEVVAFGLDEAMVVEEVDWVIPV